MILSEETKIEIYRSQQNEITESVLYRRLASIEKNESNRKVLVRIAEEEKTHYEILKQFTGREASPKKFQIRKYYLMARILGLTFTIKLMEMHEGYANNNYNRIADEEEQREHTEGVSGKNESGEEMSANSPVKVLRKLSVDEDSHEQRLIALINEERLSYMGSVVLGLNDALVEFTGALAGFTLALSDNKLIALTGCITGVAAALSMASSEYLSTKTEADGSKHPVKAAVYTGITYFITVIALILPYILISRVLVALAVMLVIAILIIALFNYYYAIARSESFKRRFMEMAVLSFGVAGISFVIGYLLKLFTGISS
ncbi:MAG: VIT1/CCC1 transporter family protein [Bacteroidales bacterium]|jgi:VIT1/CCC1 family predicted Fe2+/Mn2+ transporter|nr:VIT1/CCC1 transporter family protein [Bacteroidales bacterium]